MNVEPLPKALFDQITSAGIDKIHLEWRGGDDEGHLFVFGGKFDSNNDEVTSLLEHDLETAIIDWAWDVYHYNGAGDGSEYGDNIAYDLKNKTVTIDSWYTERVHTPGKTIPFELDETELDETIIVDTPTGAVVQK